MQMIVKENRSLWCPQCESDTILMWRTGTVYSNVLWDGYEVYPTQDSDFDLIDMGFECTNCGNEDWEVPSAQDQAG